METAVIKKAIKKAEEYANAVQAQQEFKLKHWQESLEELKALPEILHFEESILGNIPKGEHDFRKKLILSRYLTFPLARTRKKTTGGEVKSLPYNIGYRITNTSSHPFPYKVLVGELEVVSEDEIKTKTHLLTLETRVIAPTETVTFSRYEMYLLTINPLSYGHGVNFEVRFRGDDLYIVAPTFSTSDDFNVTSVTDENFELRREFENNIGIRIDASIKNWEALSYNKKEITSNLASRLAHVHKSIKNRRVDIGID